MATGSNSRGIVMMLLSVLAFTSMDATVKALVAHYSLVQVVGVRYAFQFVLILVVNLGHLPRLLHTRHPRLQGMRSVFQLGATTSFFAALGFIGLAAATAIADLAPILITLGAAVFLRERIGPRRVAAGGVAFVGALIIIRPGSDVFTAASLLPLLAATCYAANVLVTRRVGTADGIQTSLFYGAALGTLASAAALPFTWTPVAAADLWLFALTGALGMAAQILMIRALREAEASLLAPFGQSDLVFATFWGVLIFGEWPDLWTVIGALVVGGAGLYVWHRETRALPRPLREGP